MAREPADDRPGKYGYESIRVLRLENRELRHELSEMQARLQAETARAERCAKSAAEAWELREARAEDGTAAPLTVRPAGR